MRQQRRVTAKQALDAAQRFSRRNSTYCGHFAPPTIDRITGRLRASVGQ
jgi:hypothetical protein